ncbi:hypothetical protein ES708_18476 [subsurface metagenome]
MKAEDLKKFYGRLIRLNNSLGNGTINKVIVEDFHGILKEISEIIKENMDTFKIPDSEYNSEWGEYERPVPLSKIEQVISYLNYGYSLNDKIIEIGSLVNVVKNQDLKERCTDLLSAQGNFDRVINQATQILEDKIRKKSEITERLEGVNLVNKVFNTDISKTILKASNDPDEHEGFCHICRGIMLGFRNPTHHYLTDKFSREEALNFCGFIDTLLSIIESSEKK